MGRKQQKKTENHIADESEKTQKTREKLKKQFLEIEKKITPQALKEKSHEIHQWIERHTPHRVVLKDQSISLFDENQNSAPLSAFSSVIVEKLQETLAE